MIEKSLARTQLWWSWFPNILCAHMCKSRSGAWRSSCADHWVIWNYASSNSSEFSLPVERNLSESGWLNLGSSSEYCTTFHMLHVSLFHHKCADRHIFFAPKERGAINHLWNGLDCCCHLQSVLPSRDDWRCIISTLPQCKVQSKSDLKVPHSLLLWGALTNKFDLYCHIYLYPYHPVGCWLKLVMAKRVQKHNIQGNPHSGIYCPELGEYKDL